MDAQKILLFKNICKSIDTEAILDYYLIRYSSNHVKNNSGKIKR